MMKDRKIVLGVTGGIAAYKACDLVRRFKKAGAEVRVVMTKNACEFVAPLTFETLSGNPAYTDEFDRKYEIGHVALAKWADLMVVAPATANCLAKMRAGIADDLLSTTLLAMTCPVLVAPAMNAAMWRNAATCENVEVLKSRGIAFVGPGSGDLACGVSDVGRMSEPEEIAAAADKILSPVTDLNGKKILVTAGPTVERIDPVRYITNRSTGKMGYAIAEAAAARGAEVVLVSGPVALAAPVGVTRVSVESS
ncbi:MAG: bifunctional phosphopantothenoylcysteine decarboxylase/phosphopantothenate--cysteine ligase CoaBC, partial [Clostridia bacterium]|nr:bifunctional phosphopantothenoylcysteine decarboxylase/phosphopantothenate--cysteine ligase CoaBC [Clostridia bacterium]